MLFFITLFFFFQTKNKKRKKTTKITLFLFFKKQFWHTCILENIFLVFWVFLLFLYFVQSGTNSSWGGEACLRSRQKQKTKKRGAKRTGDYVWFVIGGYQCRVVIGSEVSPPDDKLQKFGSILWGEFSPRLRLPRNWGQQCSCLVLSWANVEAHHDR